MIGQEISNTCGLDSLCELHQVFRRRHTHFPCVSKRACFISSLSCSINSISHGIVLPSVKNLNSANIFRYAEVAALNSEQTPEQTSAPAPQTIQNETSSSDAASYTTGGLSDPSSVRVIDRSEISELNTTDERVVSEPSPSITIHLPAIQDDSHGDAENSTGPPSSLKEKFKKHKKLSKKDQKIAIFGGVGTLNLLALGAVGYWGYKRYSNGENGWKVLGVAAGIWAGVTVFEWLSVRYAPTFV